MESCESDCPENYYVIIPARLNSSRLPKKMLLEVNGIPLIIHTLRSALDQHPKTYVATDSQEIYDTVTKYHPDHVVLTGECRCGTVRVAEAAKKLGLSQQDVIVNLQGDEPELLKGNDLLTRLVQKLRSGSDITTAYHMGEMSLIHIIDPSKVKMTIRHDGDVLSFSRDTMKTAGDTFQRRHIGIYCYKYPVLHQLAILDSTGSTDLEQVDWVKAYRVSAVGVNNRSISIDTPDDFAAWKDYACSQDLPPLFQSHFTGG